MVTVPAPGRLPVMLLGLLGANNDMFAVSEKRDAVTAHGILKNSEVGVDGDGVDLGQVVDGHNGQFHCGISFGD
jgi:hypothetical protein